VRASSSPCIVAGTTTTASVSGRDQQGQPIATGPVTWTSSNTAVATVDAAGTVTGVAAGNVTLTGTAGGISGSVPLAVTPAPALARLVLTLSTTTPRSGDRVTVTVSGLDCAFHPSRSHVSLQSDHRFRSKAISRFG
jgi:uncharacterized protein YjdB